MGASLRKYQIQLMSLFPPSYFYRTRVRSLAMLVTHWLTNSLTHCRLVNLIDVTLACEDGNSKLVVTVWLCLSLTDWLTHWLTDCCLVNLIDVTLACEDAFSKLVGLLLLLMLMMRIVLATVCCILGSWGLVIKPNFCSDFEHKVPSRFWSWSSG